MKMDGPKQIEPCPICKGPFKNPRSLPCYHCFCTECLQNAINNMDSSNNCFPCPCCRRPAEPKDNYLPLLAKGFPMVKSTDTKKENPSPFYCIVCMHNKLYVDAVANNRCYSHYYNDHDNYQPEMHELLECCPPLGLGNQTSPQNAVEPDVFCMKCLTFSYGQCYAFNHAVCNEENAVKPIPVAANEMRDNMESLIENMDNLLGKSHDIMKKLSKLGQKWQQFDFETRVIFSMDEHIEESYSQHLATLNEMILEIQHLPKSICDHLEDLKVQQKIKKDEIYLKIKSHKEYSDDLDLFNYQLDKIAKKMNNLEQAFQALEKTLNLALKNKV